MSTYNMVFGRDDTNLFKAISNILKTDEFGRYRDCWVELNEKEEPIIAIYTRNGGGNREGHMPDFSKHANYLYDKDDDFDCTYATIYFSTPDEYKDDFSKIAKKEPVNMSENWKILIDNLFKK